MGPDFLDRQSLWYMFCCNFICLVFLIKNSSFLAGYPAGYRDIEKAGYPCNPTYINM